MCKKLMFREFSLKGSKTDMMKLVLCYMIVILHTIGTDYISPILRCAVPLFFMLSSYFIFGKISRCETLDEKQKALKGYVKRNLQLYLFWTLIFSPFIVLFRNWFDGGIIEGIPLMIRGILFAGTFPASWYIIASVWGTIFIYYSSRYLPQYVLWLICILCYVFCVLSSNYGMILEHCNTYEFYCNIFSNPYNSYPVSFIWIFLGKYLAENKISMSNRKLVMLLSLSFIMLLVEYVAISRLVCAVADDCYIFLVPFCYFLLLLIGRIECSKPSLLICRKISTITYCSHLTIAFCLGSLLIYLFGWKSRLLILLLTALCTLILSSLILFFEKKNVLGG